ncbi:hypothetical protein [Pinibacter aurantiacus]|uniref:Uncharacterized protein n=1 Tax=Pinibacter aurantiacus TaxID=2851599 RepID=A0A9E2SF89_9BACT|nr:hypothetical protein [Pinibacter aurantiacus]MBV4360607.1 hypothetical protein [Pinibacter aurantiacus]
MKIICVSTTSKGFDLKEVTTVLSNDFDYGHGGHGLEINREYIVMGTVIYQDSSCLYYLIDVNGKPEWFPHLLFDVLDNTLPKRWFMKIYEKDGDGDIYSILGFDELCNNEDFYDLLLVRDDEAMRIYFKQKAELEKELAEE